MKKLIIIFSIILVMIVVVGCVQKNYNTTIKREMNKEEERPNTGEELEKTDTDNDLIEVSLDLFDPLVASCFNQLEACEKRNEVINMHVLDIKKFEDRVKADSYFDSITNNSQGSLENVFTMSALPGASYPLVISKIMLVGPTGNQLAKAVVCNSKGELLINSKSELLCPE